MREGGAARETDSEKLLVLIVFIRATPSVCADGANVRALSVWQLHTALATGH